MTQLIVRGHTLAFEGAAFDDDGRRVRSQGTGGTGRAHCSCGTRSEPLTSGAKRQAWHRDHKTESITGENR